MRTSHVYGHRDLPTTRQSRAYTLLLHDETADSRYVPDHRCYLDLTRRNLAKFFTMPPGKKAPPQQSSLTELWGSKPKKQSTLAVPADASSGNPHSAPQADSHGSVDAAGPTTSSEERAYCFSLGLLRARSSCRNTSLFTAISKRKPETATDFDSAYARVPILSLYSRRVDLFVVFCRGCTGLYVAGTASASPERHGPLRKRRKRVIEEDEGDEDEGPAPSSGAFLLLLRRPL